MKEENKNELMLTIRITILMVRFKYNFLNSPQDYQTQLKKLFNYEYTIEKIQLALHELEEAHIVGEADKSLGIIEYPEDFNY